MEQIFNLILNKIIKMIKKLLVAIFLILSIYWFYKINNLNYEVIRKTKLHIVNHPEWLPKKNVAKITSFWFENLKADKYWLETIQYIWENAIKSEYKVYLYQMLDLITELNPYFYHPYKIWLLLLPDYNSRYENLDLKTQEQHKLEAIKIWQKWIKKLCDFKIIEKIKNENNLLKIWNNKEYQDPCLDSDIPYYLAFDYYFYLNKPEKAALYYKVASANKDSLKWSRVLAAIMQWKAWNREKSFFMFINMAQSTAKDKNDECYIFSNELQKIGFWIFSNKINFDWKLLQKIEQLRRKFVWEYDEKEDLNDWFCKNYLNKATRELNLAYIEKANEKYKKEHDWKSAQTTKELYNNWYINYIPIDYQQTKDYWIIYKYNSDTWNFDYKLENKD
jgi:hypothetical protein